MVTRQSHRELALDDTSDLLALIAALLAELANRQQGITLEEIEAYISERLEAQDAEWRQAASAPGAKKWLMKLAQSG